MRRRTACCNESVVRKGPWTPEEDNLLIDYIQKHGHGKWRALPKLAGLNRCGKSCRLRWINYLRPDIKREKFTEEEEQIIINSHAALGNKWSAIAALLPGRTDNDIKNFWNSHLKKKLLRMGLDPITHRPILDQFNPFSNLQQLLAATNILCSTFTNSCDTTNSLRLLQNLFQTLGTNNNNNIPTSNMELLNNAFGQSSSSSLPIPDSFLNYELLGLNNQLSNFHGFESPFLPLPTTGSYQHMNAQNNNSFYCMESQKVEAANTSFTNLVSAPPECSSVKQILENKLVNQNENYSNPSNEAYWKNVIE